MVGKSQSLKKCCLPIRACMTLNALKKFRSKTLPDNYFDLRFHKLKIPKLESLGANRLIS